MKTQTLRFKLIVDAGTTPSEPTEACVVPLFSDDPVTHMCKVINKASAGKFLSRLKRYGFKGESEKSVWVDIEGMPQWLVVGLGKRGELDEATVRAAYSAAAAEVLRRKVASVDIIRSRDVEFQKHFSSAIEGFLLATYRFDKYKKEPSEVALKLVAITTGDAKSASSISREMEGMKSRINATFLARDLVNEPANVVHPDSMSAYAQEVAKASGLRCRVLKEPDLKKLGLNLILAVGMGSDRRPCLVHLEYVPKKKGKTVVLVGKGVTFDSGGLSLKPQNNMYGMKCDMAGAASVLATMQAIAAAKPAAHVHGIFPLVENLPNGGSVKPGDVVVAYNGKSVEIENTDAEGRLILADALAYAEKSLKPDLMLDMATLTGACVVALGEEIAGIFTRNTKLADLIEKTGRQNGEKFWPLPMESSYKRAVKSDVADIKNVGNKWAGATNGALFLEEFVTSKNWAHLDIAGPAFLEHEVGWGPKGATGFPVRTLLRIVCDGKF